MNEAVLKVSAGQLRLKTQRLINDTCIWSLSAADALAVSLQDTEFLKKRSFLVPSRRPRKKVVRKPEQIAALLQRATSRDLFASIFVFLVAHVEDFFISICKIVLHHDNRRIKTRVQGIDHITKIEISEIIEARSREKIIEALIEREMQAVFHSRPAAYFTYLERVIGISLDEKSKDSWNEIKATRDIIVHNSGIVNGTYLDNARSKARGTLGDVVPLDRAYFEDSVATMKSLVGKAESSVRKSLRPGSASRTHSSTEEI
jgi:hypothetical protein